MAPWPCCSRSTSRRAIIGLTGRPGVLGLLASYLATLDVGRLWWSIVIGNLSILAVFMARRALTPAALARACCALVCLAGLLMAWQHDGHGTGILTGIAGALIVLTWRRSRTGGQGTTSAAASPA